MTAQSYVPATENNAPTFASESVTFSVDENAEAMVPRSVIPSPPLTKTVTRSATAWTTTQ